MPSNFASQSEKKSPLKAAAKKVALLGAAAWGLKSLTCGLINEYHYETFNVSNQPLTLSRDISIPGTSVNIKNGMVLPEADRVKFWLREVEREMKELDRKGDRVGLGNLYFEIIRTKAVYTSLHKTVRPPAYWQNTIDSFPPKLLASAKAAYDKNVADVDPALNIAALTKAKDMKEFHLENSLANIRNINDLRLRCFALDRLENSDGIFLGYLEDEENLPSSSYKLFSSYLDDMRRNRGSYALASAMCASALCGNDGNRRFEFRSALEELPSDHPAHQLLNERGITRFHRYPLWMLEYNLGVRMQPFETPKVLQLLADYDWNHAFSGAGYTYYPFEFLQIGEMRSAGVAERLADKFKAGDQHFDGEILGAHGDEDELDVTDADGEFQGAAKKHLDRTESKLYKKLGELNLPGAPIVLVSCSTGKGDNSIASFISKSSGKTVFAPNEDAALEFYAFRKGAIRMNYHDADPVQFYPNGSHRTSYDFERKDLPTAEELLAPKPKFTFPTNIFDLYGLKQK